MQRIMLIEQAALGGLEGVCTDINSRIFRVLLLRILLFPLMQRFSTLKSWQLQMRMQAGDSGVLGGATRRVCNREVGKAAGHQYCNAGNSPRSISRAKPKY